MSVKITQDFIPKSRTKNRPAHAMSPKYICIHNTANASKGANAKTHARYLRMGAGGRTVSWHYTVDDTEIYQHLPDVEVAWHAGDGGNGTGNRESIGIEICENSDGDYVKAEANAIWLIRKLIADHDIPIENVVTHKHWSGKNCPRKILDRWDGFIAEIKAENVTKRPTKVKSETVVNRGYLENGDTGDAVKALQLRLISAGRKYADILAPWGADGVFGGATEKAVRAFQADARITVDGLAGKQTESALDNAIADAKATPKYTLPSGVFRRNGNGQSRNHVRQIQTALDALNFRVGPIDGIYGRKTEDAVRRFQSVYVPHEVDGIYGSNTKKAIEEAL